MSLNLTAVAGVAGAATKFWASADDSVSYLISYGDGVTSQGSWRPGMEPFDINHVYASPGTYTATLTVSVAGITITGSTQVVVTGVKPPPPPPPPTGTLLHKANLSLLGAFRVPVDSSGGEWMSEGGQAPAYNQANNSLFMVGRSLFVTELSIPEIRTGPDLPSLDTAKYLQPLTKVVPRLATNPYGADRIGGLMVWNGKLVGTAHVWYDANGTSKGSHFTFDSLNLSSAVRGLSELPGATAGYLAGCMCPVPKEWQGRIGAPALTGLNNVPIISRTSPGPAAFGFDPANFGKTVVPLVAYDLPHSLGVDLGGPDPLQNLTTQIPGVVWVPGTDSVLFFGTSGCSMIGYGEDKNSWGCPNDPKGAHSLNAQYAVQVWAYNANDFLAVKRGEKKPYEVIPYDVWNLDVPFAAVGGATLDPATNRIFLTFINMDNVRSPDNHLPVVAVLQVNPSPAAEGPRVGTLAGHPVTAKSGDKDFPPYYGTYAGPVKRGDPVSLIAGNVYDPSGTDPIAKVSFYLDGVFMTDGFQSQLPHADHNWQATLATTSIASGKHTISAKATTKSGKVSSPATWTLTIK